MASLDLDTINKILGKPTTQQETAINAKVAEVLAKLSDRLNKPLKVPLIRYDLKGSVAGKANARELWLNLELLNTEWDDMLNNTLPHELAHVVVRQVWGNEPKGHGHEWQMIMRMLGLTPTRCHSYEYKPARVHSRDHKYECDCRTYTGTSHRATKMASGWVYVCSRCKGEVRYVGR